MLIVVCIEGCHGCGKSEVCRTLRAIGFDVLDEGFMDMPSFGLAPQTLVMESIWVTNWMQRLLKLQKDLRNKAEDKIVFCDRSPYSAVFYAGSNGNLLEPLIRQQIEDLKNQADIHICTVSLKVDKELLWQRIQDRLKREPERVKYNEHSRDWMEVTNNWYSTYNWDFSIDNNEHTINELAKALLAHLGSRVRRFGEVCMSSYKYPIEQPVSAAVVSSTIMWNTPSPVTVAVAEQF